VKLIAVAVVLNLAGVLLFAAGRRRPRGAVGR